MGFHKSVEKAYTEVQGRMNGRDGLLSFGVKYLDDAMIGIFKNDLILVGGASGGGKSQFCCNMALANIANGKRVHYIALEAENLEIERRIKYQLFAKSFYADSSRPKISISYQEWVIGDFIQSCVAYEAIAAQEFLTTASTLYTFYKDGNFDEKDLVKTILSCSDDTDLIILDHVHYLDLDDNNENRAIKAVAKTARSMALEIGKPIVLVSHVRKSERGSNPFAPGMEEFHGSSDLYKIATKAITLGPGGMDNGKIETYLRIVKNRNEGSVTRYLAKCLYNPSQGKYEKSYEVGDAYQDRSAGFNQLSYANYPAWAEYFNSRPSGPNVPPAGKPSDTGIKRRQRSFSVGASQD